MSTWSVIAVLTGGFLLLAILVVGAGHLWWRTYGSDLRAEGRVAIAAATEFGKSTDNQGCLEESLGRHDRCEDDFTCHVMTSVFLLHCLKASAPVSGFCDGVPASDSVAGSVTWRLDQCEQRGRTGTYCGNLFGQVQKFCESLLSAPAA